MMTLQLASRSVPGPKRILHDVANSERNIHSPAGIIGKNVGVEDPGAGSSHHLGNGIKPFKKMCRFLMPGRSLSRAIALDQGEAGWIIFLLDDIKAGDPRFLNAVPAVFNRCRFKGFNLLGFHLDKNMHDNH